MRDQSAAAAQRHKLFHRAVASTPVVSITNAADAHSKEMHGRLVKYATAMGIRMVCIVLIFVVDGWFKLIPVAGAVLLPWVAVVIANGGADVNHQNTTELLDQAPAYELNEGQIPPDSANGDDSGDILRGEVLMETDNDGVAEAGNENGKGEDKPA
ncbi:DUF3099 domain-containing protein [Arthrobacter cryoconiti]|uniref:DUF3099 domain-containing protein n=1 Tax=Arthrobacter cryoconiti TaxID=748907 RepID=A0ABV8QZ27_9MICC|nr:DUF3099 domain-containing protein [Arthrobacter cryoconiti]MCC9069612.1 DUF3099 domain-containing protein [Arthrobacter cryoconiti]